MILLSNEHRISSSNDELFVLTNIRIIHTNRAMGKANASFIFLENISSVQTTYKSSFIALILAVIFFAFAGMTVFQNEDALRLAFIGFLASIICVLYWWFSRIHIISICSNGGKPIEFQVSGLLTDQIEKFVYNLQEAKANRAIELKSL